MFDLIDILENHVTAPDIAAEALAVVACLSDNGTFITISYFDVNLFFQILFVRLPVNRISMFIY